MRLEIEAALTRNVRVIPVLVEGARMPHADELLASWPSWCVGRHLSSMALP